MSIKEQIRAEIRQRIKKYGKLADAAWGKDDPFAAETNEHIVSELQSLIVFTYTLPEQPVEGLEKEINACWQNWLSPSNQKEVEGVLPKTEFAMYARHFAEWGAEHLKK